MRNKLLVLTGIFSCLFGGLLASYQDQVDFILDRTVAQVEADHVVRVESEGLADFLEKASDSMNSGETLLINFYPKGSGFDVLIGDQKKFVGAKEFKELISQAGFKVEFCMPQELLAQFQDQDELSQFLKDQFDAELKMDQPPLKFPTKIITAKLIKN